MKASAGSSPARSTGLASIPRPRRPDPTAQPSTRPPSAPGRRRRPAESCPPSSPRPGRPGAGEALPALAPPAALCALDAGVWIATTMGFTARDGLRMGPRCGELDAGGVLHLIRQKGMSAEAVEDLLYRRSGMLGLSGISSDFRDLLASEDPHAGFAVEVFCY